VFIPFTLPNEYVREFKQVQQRLCLRLPLILATVQQQRVIVFRMLAEKLVYTNRRTGGMTTSPLSMLACEYVWRRMGKVWSLQP
jgi:hypothetical protein